MQDEVEMRTEELARWTVERSKALVQRSRNNAIKSNFAV